MSSSKNLRMPDAILSVEPPSPLENVADLIYLAKVSQDHAQTVRYLEDAEKELKKLDGTLRKVS
jgi:hypothetical protein